MCLGSDLELVVECLLEDMLFRVYFGEPFRWKDRGKIKINTTIEYHNLESGDNRVKETNVSAMLLSG